MIWELFTNSMWNRHFGGSPDSENDAEISRFGRRVKQSPWQGRRDDKIPRNNYWRPYGYFDGDRLVAITALRLNREYSCIEVQVARVFTQSHEETDSITRDLMAFWLSDAVRCNIGLLIRFVNMQRGGRITNRAIPDFVCRTADMLGVHFPDYQHGVLGQGEASLLYKRLPGFSDGTKSLIAISESDDPTMIGQIPYTVYSGRWHVSDIEYFASMTSDPNALLKSFDAASSWQSQRVGIARVKPIILSRVTRIALSQVGARVHFEAACGKWFLEPPVDQSSNWQWLPRGWNVSGQRAVGSLQQRYELRFFADTNPMLDRQQQLDALLAEIDTNRSQDPKLFVTTDEIESDHPRIHEALEQHCNCHVITAPVVQSDLLGAAFRRLSAPLSGLQGVL